MKNLIITLALTVPVYGGVNTPILVKPAIQHFSTALVDGVKHFENAPLAKQKSSYIDKRRWDKYGKCSEIGYGFTAGIVDMAIRAKYLKKGYRLPRTMRKSEADRFLTRIALPSCRYMVHRFVKVKLTKRQEEALIMFTYNLGEGALKTLVNGNDRLNSGCVTNTPLFMRKYCKAGGKPMMGLKKRRHYEVRLWQGGFKS